MTLTELETALRSATPNVYEHGAPDGVTEYAVATVYGYRLIEGDDGVAVRIPRAQIDAYTQDPDAEDDGGLFERVMNALDGAGLVYTVEDVGYDDGARALRLILQCDLA